MLKSIKLFWYFHLKRTGYGKNLAYVKDVNKTASQLGPILGIDVNELTSKLQTAKDEGRYQIELGTKGNNLSASVKKQIEDCNLIGNRVCRSLIRDIIHWVIFVAML